MSKWKLRQPTIPGASQQLALLFAQPKVKADIENALRLLATQEHPGKPDKSIGLDVMRLENEAPDWYRLKLYEHNIRVIFRLLVVRGEHLVEVDHYEIPEGDERYLDVVQAEYRTYDTYHRTRRLYLRTRRK